MGALVEIAEVSPAEPLSPELEGCFIDTPRAGAVFDAEEVDVIGWALGAERKAVAVEFGYGGEAFWRAKLRSPRPDLAEIFPDRPDAASAGFRTTVDLLGTAAEFELEVAAVLRGRRRAPIATLRGRRRWRRDRDPAYAELVSVIVSAGLRADLDDAIKSVRGQSYPHVELVVIEDGSIAAARNAGLRNSNGDFLVFLDADDLLLPDALAAGVGALEERPECAAAIAGYRGYEQLRDEGAGSSADAIYRRSLFEHLRGFDPSLGAAAGFALELAVAREFAIASHPAPALARHRP